MDVLNSYNKSIKDIIERTRRSVPKLPDPQWFHVFFIYKTILPDKDIVTKLLQNLEVLGYKCGNHKNDFVPGKTVFQNVHDCLQKSLTLVILLSKEFCLSEWCKYDLEVAQNLKLKKGQKLQIIPLVLDDCDIPDLISHTTYLEVDMENIDAWHGRFLRTVYESMNVDNAIFHSPSSSSICQRCEKLIENTTNEEYKDEDFQLDKEVERYSDNMFSQSYYDNYDLISKSGCHVTYPEFMLLQKRLSSFDELNWTSKGLPDRRIMAINGFFLSSNGSSVRCFQCGISLFDWSPEDDPEFEHARWSPKCPYIVAKQGQQYIDLVGEAVTEVEMMEEEDKFIFRIEKIMQSLNKMEMLRDPPGLSLSLASSPKWESLSSLSSFNVSSESLPPASPAQRMIRDTYKKSVNDLDRYPCDSGYYNAFGSAESVDVLPYKPPPRRHFSFRDDMKFL